MNFKQILFFRWHISRLYMTHSSSLVENHYCNEKEMTDNKIDTLWNAVTNYTLDNWSNDGLLVGISIKWKTKTIYISQLNKGRGSGFLHKA